MNISLTWPIHALGEINISSRGGWSKKHAPAKAVGPLFHPPNPQAPRCPFPRARPQPFDARSVLPVCERERRQEQQVCEPKGAKGRDRRWRLFSTFPV
ncbi:MAG: hypothetical protein VST68_03330 [Nitrospirota bacterium]|nr:hypothetical protein [Nitrospirota bacterium]